METNSHTKTTEARLASLGAEFLIENSGFLPTETHSGLD